MTNNALNGYKKVIRDMISVSYPNISTIDIDKAIDYSIMKRYKEEPCRVYNDYKNTEVKLSLIDLVDYILKREPIITAYGVMFKKHGEEPNPFSDMIKMFMINRGILKKKMFQYPKGTEMYNRYNLAQLLEKLNANAGYGAIGMYSCLYYNLHVCSSITSQARSLVSTLGMFFESFLANNVKFGSMDECVMFIHNIISEKRHWKDIDILDRNISHEECFYRISMTFGFEYIPTEDELDSLWDIIRNLGQEDINRLYYKNNLYEFVSNSKMVNCIREILRLLKYPFLYPNKCPKEIEVEMEVFENLLKEYVYYGYHYIDRIDRMDNMIKSVVAISDTDSTIVSFDKWYNFILDMVRDDDRIIINKYAIDAVSYCNNEVINLVMYNEPNIDYDFYSDEMIIQSKALNLTSIIPQDNLRYSIINILAYCISNILDTHFDDYCKRSYSYDGDPCLIVAKNEFLFKRALLTPHKKNYATNQEIQEGNAVNRDARLDMKGLAISKTSINKNTRDKLEKILYEDILNSDTIDRISILKKLAIVDKQIYQSLESGSRDYYKPVVIKSFENYEDPFKIQGIKASMAWNELRGDLDPIDLKQRNAIDIVKVNITIEKASNIKESYPELYYKIVDIFTTGQLKDVFKGHIKSLAIPKDIEVPSWVKEFINYKEIINDNLKNFPLESIGILRQGKDTINYTNIIKI